MHAPVEVGTARRRAVWLLATTVVLILYVSFYPFQFDAERTAHALDAGIANLIPRDYSSLGDRVGNLLFYLPFGLLAAYLAPRRRSWIAAVALALVAGTALSCGVEILQNATRVRVPNRLDVMMNAMGTGVGALLGAALRGRTFHARLLPLRAAVLDPVALLLLLLWVAVHAWPFMPRLSLYKAGVALAPLQSLAWHATGVAVYAACYLIVAASVRRLVERQAYWRVLCAFCFGCLLMRLVFIRQVLTLDECAGLAVAAPLAVILHARTRVFAFRVAAVLATVVLAADLALDVSAVPSGAVLFLQRAFIVLGVLWLAGGAAVPMAFATVGLVALVAALDSLQGAALALVGAMIVHAGRVWLDTRRIDVSAERA